VKGQILLTLVLATSACSFAANLPTKALSPEQERASFHLADPELVIELLAAEPDVISPVAMAWDEKGRLFVAEMSDYPSGPISGRIKMLEDRDGDGHYEHVSVFADKLAFPNGVLPWNGGLLVTAAPDILFLMDTDGDGRVDERHVLLTGFGQGNQQLRVNGLMWGLDNWIYGANGRSDGEVRWVEAVKTAASPDSAKEKSVTFSLRGHDFRFRPGARQLETIAGRSQFGLARDDWGNRFLSWNTIPVRHEVLPEHYLSRRPQLPATESVADILASGDDGRVFPLTPSPLTFNNESTSHFNALAGLTVYRGDGLGEKYRGNAFVGESLRNLVHRRVLIPNGPTFVAQRGERESEFLASTDPWFHPVNFATGPDGALYVVDFYRQFVEHPDFVPQKLRGQVAWRTGAEHGRIWRIRHSKTISETPTKRLSTFSHAELVKCLGHPNGWWRDTAQRLLVERHDSSAVRLLKSQIQNLKTPAVARLHALYTLEGLGILTPQVAARALKDPDAHVREHAIRLSESFAEERGFPQALIALADDPDSRVRFQLALSLGELRGEGKLSALTTLARKDATNRWHALGILSSVGPRPWLFFTNLIAGDEQWLERGNDEVARFVDRLALLVGASQSESDLGDSLAWLSASAPETRTRLRLVFLAGFAQGLAQENRPLRRLLQERQGGFKRSSLDPLIQTAIETAKDSDAPGRLRVAAIRVLGQIEPATSKDVLCELLLPRYPVEVQSAAANALIALNDHEVASGVFTNWSRYSRAIRQQILAGAPRSPGVTTALINSLEQGGVKAIELSPSSRQDLQKVSNAELKQRLEKVLKMTASPDREEVVRLFQPALKMTGSRQRGAEIFAQNCLSCHALEGLGQRVGADLSGLASRPKEALLIDILDPSRQVSPDFVSYTVVTAQGEIPPGLIAAENANSITLRRAGTLDETILRNQIVEVRAEGKSLMPEGLEQGMDQQAMADLLAFLQQPDAALLSESVKH
jgi:putative membrane-bound dehydrogenase-like protein